MLEDEVQMKQKSIKRGSEKHKNNSVPRVMYLCYTFDQTYIHLGRQFLLSYFLFQFSMNMTLQSIVDQSCAKLLTMDKKIFEFKQLHKEEKWNYEKSNQNVFRIQHDYPVLGIKYGNFGKTLLFFYAVNISLILLCDCFNRKVFNPGGSNNKVFHKTIVDLRTNSFQEGGMMKEGPSRAQSVDPWSDTLKVKRSQKHPHTSRC